MVEANFNVKGDLIGLSAEVSMLTSEIITLDDGSRRHNAPDGRYRRFIYLV